MTEANVSDGGIMARAWTLITGGSRTRVLWLIILIGLALRLYRIDAPLIDAYHTRQTQTAMVTLNLYKDGFRILYPKMNVFGDSPGHIILEFPIINALTAALYYLFGVKEIIGRLMALSFSLATLPLMFALGRRLFDETTGLWAAFLFAVLPANVYFGRAFMPEAPMLFFSVAAVLTFHIWLEEGGRWRGALAVISAAFAYLAKTPTLIYIPPVIAFLSFSKHGWKTFKRPELYLYTVLSLTPIALWMVHGDIVNRTGGLGHTVDNLWLYGPLSLRLKRHWYLTILDHLFRAILTPLGVLFLALGMLLRVERRDQYAPYVWIFFFGVYVMILAGGQGHYYYQIPLVPPASLLIGRFLTFASRSDSLAFIRRYVHPAHLQTLLALLFIGHVAMYIIFFSESYSLTKRIPHHPEAAAVVRENTPEDALILVADFQEGLPTDFLYFADRKGYYVSLEGSPTEIMAEIEKGIAKGADIFAVVVSGYHTMDEFNYKGDLSWRMRRRFPTLAKTDFYHIFQLIPPE